MTDLAKLPHLLMSEGVTTPFVVGVLASAISGWLAITVLLRLVARYGYGSFAVYRLVLGILVLYVAFTRMR